MKVLKKNRLPTQRDQRSESFVDKLEEQMGKSEKKHEKSI